MIEGLRTRLKVGLEVHVELATRTKMWTAAPNIAHGDHYDAGPNTLTDPVVLGLPGALPVMNREAVVMAIRVGLALGCTIARFTKWDRKSYYYPDLPKNYQISQYDLPLCRDGRIDVPLSDDPDAETAAVRITRAHLEEDAGKLLHEAPGGGPIDHSIVDLNRAGTPLLEIVTEPDFHSADHAVAFCKLLRNICRFLGVSEGVMQRGHMRFEPNINVLIERDGREYATPVVEVKNLNSFRAVRAAVEHEHRRQVERWLADGRTMGPGAKSTRGWDEARLVTFAQREKEDAHDYRYFPDPDLVPVEVSGAWLEELRAGIPELPPQRERRYVERYGLSRADARALTAERDLCLFFESVVEAGVEPKRAPVVLRNNLARMANERNTTVHSLGITPQQIAEIERRLKDNQISSNAADHLYAAIANDSEKGVSVTVPTAEVELSAPPPQIKANTTLYIEKLIIDHGLLQVSDDTALDEWINQAIEAEPQAAADFRNGKRAAIGRLVGAVMKRSGGRANPRVVQEKLRERLTG